MTLGPLWSGWRLTDGDRSRVHVQQVEDEMQRLFTSHTNVFDERMQSFFIQNYIHEAECAKTFRAAVRRTSLVRRCLLAMYPSDDASSKRTATQATTGAAAEKPRRWSASLVARAVQQHHTRSNSLEVCPEVVNPVVIETVKRQVAKLADWDFDVFAVRLLLSLLASFTSAAVGR